MNQVVDEEKSLQEELHALEKQLRQKEKEMKSVKRNWERQIEQQQDSIMTIQTQNSKLEAQIEKEKNKITEHQLTKCKDKDMEKLEKELEAI